MTWRLRGVAVAVSRRRAARDRLRHAGQRRGGPRRRRVPGRCSSTRPASTSWPPRPRHQVPGATTADAPETVAPAPVPGDRHATGQDDPRADHDDPGWDHAHRRTTATATDGKCTAAGAPLNLGQIGSFSGVLGAISASARTTLAIWAKHVNALAAGLPPGHGLRGRRRRGPEPRRGGRPGPDRQQEGLRDRRHVHPALAAGDPAGASSGNKVPIVGGDGVDFAWINHPLLFPQGASLDGLVDGGLRQTVASGKNQARAALLRRGQHLHVDGEAHAGPRPRPSAPRWCTAPRSR